MHIYAAFFKIRSDKQGGNSIIRFQYSLNEKVSVKWDGKIKMVNVESRNQGGKLTMKTAHSEQMGNR